MSPNTIALVPIGPVSTDLLSWLAHRLEDVLDAEAGYDSVRDQYAGGAMLNGLRARFDPEADRILGLTDVDCYAPDLNFVFGQAALRAGPAFVALLRLRPSFYGLTADRRLYRERVLKEAVHELGHTWGLQHCENPECVMHFSNRFRDTDLKRASFCKRCQRLLQQKQEPVGA